MMKFIRDSHITNSNYEYSLSTIHYNTIKIITACFCVSVWIEEASSNRVTNHKCYYQLSPYIMLNKCSQ